MNKKCCKSIKDYPKLKKLFKMKKFECEEKNTTQIEDWQYPVILSK